MRVCAGQLSFVNTWKGYRIFDFKHMASLPYTQFSIIYRHTFRWKRFFLCVLPNLGVTNEGSGKCDGHMVWVTIVCLPLQCCCVFAHYLRFDASRKCICISFCSTSCVTKCTTNLRIVIYMTLFACAMLKVWKKSC